MAANESERGPASGAEAGAEPTAAELFDPAAFARRIAEARERRIEVLARRSAPPGADLPPKPARVPPAGAELSPPSATVPPPAPQTDLRGARGALAHLLTRLRWRPFAVFGLGACFGAAMLLATQIVLPGSAAAPEAHAAIANLPAATTAASPALPGRQMRVIRAPLPEAAPDPRRVAALLPDGGMAASPPARPDDLVLLAAGSPRATAPRQSRRASGPPPGLPRLLDRLVDDTARATATLVRDLRRIPRELARSTDRQTTTRSSRGPRRD